MSSFTVERAPSFETDVAPLRRKHRKLNDDLDKFCAEELSVAPMRQSIGRNPIPGVPGVWKARMGIPSARIGARGGLRLIYYVRRDPPLVMLLRAYPKSDTQNLATRVLRETLRRMQPYIEARAAERGLSREMIAKLFPK